jgi:hypothetical protein
LAAHGVAAVRQHREDAANREARLLSACNSGTSEKQCRRHSSIFAWKVELAGDSE